MLNFLMLQLDTHTHTKKTLPVNFSSVFHTFLPQILSLCSEPGRDRKLRADLVVVWPPNPKLQNHLPLKLGEESHAITCDINHVLQKQIPSLSFAYWGLLFFMN